MREFTNYEGKIIIMLAGAQGSGKTTTMQNFLKCVPERKNWVGISTDNVRKSIENAYRLRGKDIPNYSLLNADKRTGDYITAWEEQADEILTKAEYDVEKALFNSKNVIIEGTHCTSKKLDKLKEKGVHVFHFALITNKDTRQERLDYRSYTEKAGRSVKDQIVRGQLDNPYSAASQFVKYVNRVAEENDFSIIKNNSIERISSAQKVYKEIQHCYKHTHIINNQ